METEAHKVAKNLATDLAATLKPGAIICLEGDLGSGKTTFVKQLAEAFAINPDMVVSPTFTYLNLYDISPNPETTLSKSTPSESVLAHFDLYRLENLEQFLSMGFDEYLEAPYITCIEWPEIIHPLIPKSAIWIHLAHTEEGGRSIKISSNRETPSEHSTGDSSCVN